MVKPLKTKQFCGFVKVVVPIKHDNTVKPAKNGWPNAYAYKWLEIDGLIRQIFCSYILSGWTRSIRRVTFMCFHWFSELHFVLHFLTSVWPFIANVLVRPFFRGRYSFITNWTSFTCPFDVGSLRAPERKGEHQFDMELNMISTNFGSWTWHSMTCRSQKYHGFLLVNEHSSLHSSATWGARFDLRLSHSAWELPQGKSYQRGCGVPREQRYYGFEPQRNLSKKQAEHYCFEWSAVRTTMSQCDLKCIKVRMKVQFHAMLQLVTTLGKSVAEPKIPNSDRVRCLDSAEIPDANMDPSSGLGVCDSIILVASCFFDLLYSIVVSWVMCFLLCSTFLLCQLVVWWFTFRIFWLEIFWWKDSVQFRK